MRRSCARELAGASPHWRLPDRVARCAISPELAAAGYLNGRGQPLNPNCIKLMLEG